MKPSWIAAAIVGIALGLHSWFHVSLISIFPLPFLLAATIAWSAGRPMVWLTALAVFSELLTTYFPGVVTAAIFLPWVVRISLRQTEARLSFSFFLTLLLTVLGQVAILLIFDLRDDFFPGLPTTRVLMTAGGTALAAYVFCISWRELALPTR